jgi:hypothetical protein
MAVAGYLYTVKEGQIVHSGTQVLKKLIHVPAGFPELSKFECAGYNLVVRFE